MSLFTRGRSWKKNGLLDKPVNQRIPSSTQPADDGSNLLTAESVKRLAAYVKNNNVASVLDCGPFSAHNFRVLSEAGCTQVHYADLYATHSQGIAAGEDMTQITQAIFASARQMTYEFIFLWDIPNYLSRQEMRSFFCLLGDKVKPGGCLSMLVHTRRHMPSVPLHFRFVEDLQAFSVENWPTDAMTKLSPGMRRTDIEADCYPFVFDRSFLCRYGLQENILLLPLLD